MQKESQNLDLLQDTLLSKRPDWVRWTIMFPATLIGCIVFLLLLALLQSFQGFGDNSNLYRISCEIVRSILFGFALVSIPAYIAPKRQLVVAAVVSLILVILFTMMWTASMLISPSSGGDKLFFTFHILLSSGGVIGAYLNVRSELGYTNDNH